MPLRGGNFKALDRAPTRRVMIRITMQRRPIFKSALSLLLLATSARAEGLCQLPELGQLLVSVTPAWSANQGVLLRFERDSGSNWRQVGSSHGVAIGIGSSGMAWTFGSGHLPAPKREGDLKSPAGIFQLGDAFGKAADPIREAVPGEDRIAYHVSNPQSICVDAPSHPRYNTILWDGWVPGDSPASHEKMLRDDTLYDLGIEIRHNQDPVRPGMGSCIFMHLREKSTGTTAGCTAMDSASLHEVVRWIRPSRGVRFVQLPLAVYQSRRKKWCLPAITPRFN